MLSLLICFTVVLSHSVWPHGSAKDHERFRLAGESVIDYELSISSTLPKRDAIMKSKNKKRMLASMLNTFSVGDSVTLETKDDRAFCHDETDITMIRE